MSFFKINEYFPPTEKHTARIERYAKNKKIFKGEHADIFNKDRLTKTQLHQIYIAINLAGIICKKNADFLFGETPVFSAGNGDNSPEQRAIERHVEDNDLHITNYESALSNSYRGDSFYKIRFGQRFGGKVSEKLDPYRVFIESQKPQYVFPETADGDDTTLLAYHIAVPVVVDGTADQTWTLNVESHYPGYIEYSKYLLNPFRTSTFENAVVEWKIVKEFTSERYTVATDVPFPLLVHVPNYSLDDDWEGIDDLSEHESLFDEINNRISRISEILDKHSDPAMAVPAGTLKDDGTGNPVFAVGSEKIFEMVDKTEVEPKYITWDGKLDAAYKELEFLIEQFLIVAELPPVALGKQDAGTSGATGAAVKYRMNSLIAKINRKRQYFDKALKRVLLIAQLLEHAKMKNLDYEVTIPKITFKDGLPDDEMEQATISNIKTGGKPTQSQLSAIMQVNNFTEEQARLEQERIREEEKADLAVDSSIFNSESGDE